MKHEKKKSTNGGGGGKRKGRKGDNTETLSRGKQISAIKKMKKAARVEACTFDSEARAAYLTGFHQRKQERRSAALKKNEAQARQDRLEMRAELRRKRRSDLEQRVAAHRAELGLDEEGEPVDEQETWTGFSDDDADADDNKPKKAPRTGLWELNEYEDDEKLVSVEVSEM